MNRRTDDEQDSRNECLKNALLTGRYLDERTLAGERMNHVYDELPGFLDSFNARQAARGKEPL